MPRFAANLSWLFTEVPFLERFGRAAAAGFEGVEFLFPEGHAPAAIAAELERHGLALALFNAPPGDWAAGERGTASLPGREAEFMDGVRGALALARATGCRTVHCMAGLVPPGADRGASLALYAANLRRAAREAAADGVTIAIEPINARDMPGYLLARVEEGCEVIAAVGEPNLKLQFDLYHAQITGGDLARRFEAARELTAHVQVAGVPDRREPDAGEVAYPYLFELLDRLGYPGWVGCEYRPRGRTEDGLGWLAPWRRGGAGR